jgi:general secretion pathway protein L
MAVPGSLTQNALKGWRWWTGELRACIPQRLRSLALSRDLRVEMSANAITVRRSSRSISSFPLPLDSGNREALTRLLKRRRLTVIVPAERAVSCVVDLPLAAERAVSQALRYEVDRRTPFKADAVYLGYKVRERDSAARRLKVEMVCAPRRLLDPLRGVAASAPAVIGSLIAELPSGNVDLGFGENQRATGGPGRIVALGFGLGCAAAIAGLAIPLMRIEAAADSMEAEIADLRVRAGRAAELEREIVQITARETALDTFLQGKAPLVFLAELASITGDDTYITGFRFDGNAFQIDGSAASAAAVVQAIEGSPHFRNPTFRTAVTPDADAGEDFSLSFLVEQAVPEDR